MKLTVVVPAGVPTPDLVTATTPRRMQRADELAVAMGKALGTEVAVIEGTLADAPATGYLLVFDLSGAVEPHLGARIVAFAQDRSTIMKTVEAHQLAAAVEKQRYFEWCTRRDSERAYGLVGRKDVAASVPARVVTGPFTTASYALLASDGPGDLVSLLAAYLKAYAKVARLD